MKIAVLSDIHGNDIALEAVLTEASQSGVERLFILGDLVGYYYRPHHVIEIISKWTCDKIQGNHEYLLGCALKNEDEAEKIKLKYGCGIQIAMDSMDPKSIDELVQLPSRKSIQLEGMQFEPCHGSPWDRDEYIYPNANIEVLDKCKVAGANMVFMGHTHYPFVFSRNNTLIVNAGSVGQARDAGGRASWALVNTSNQSLVLKSTPYEVTSLIKEVKEQDPHLPYLHEVLMRNPTTRS